MANTNTDLTEEDAADLQFPKESEQTTKISDILDGNEMQSYCASCFSDIQAPFIMCFKCKLPKCTFCFSKGVEFLNHKNDHDYQVYKEDFCLFENSDWAAREEVTLLESLMRCGNWDTVENELRPKRSVQDIKEHYTYFYLEGNGSPLLPKIKESQSEVFPQIVAPYKFKISNVEDPPRFQPNSLGYSQLAGYNPARSDFENDYDASAEDMLSNLKVIEKDDPHCALLSKLQCAIFKSYNKRLQERQRWKKIMRNHGLILVRRCISWLARYEFTITKPVYTKLLRFMQFCQAEKFEYLMEGLHRIGELRLQISRLECFRAKGITTIPAAKLYLKLNKLHEEYQKDFKIFKKNPIFGIKSTVSNHVQLVPFKKRQGFTPLEILGMPGYEKLTQNERELCITARLVPLTYFELKDALVAENKKLGSLKLQTARKLLKIDVNKTRRLYDFLADQGYITKPICS